LLGDGETLRIVAIDDRDRFVDGAARLMCVSCQHAVP
jgi:hypothetical protein